MSAANSSAHCRNCATFLGEPVGKFCPNCGQDTLNHPPSFWEFIHEFITHYVALEGKLWKTLLLLFFKPAQLTREYREGRKQRYISPLRLYITASFLFFLVFKFFDFTSVSFDDAAPLGETKTISFSSKSAVKSIDSPIVIEFGDTKKVDATTTPSATPKSGDEQKSPEDALESAIEGWKKTESFNFGCNRWDAHETCAWLEKRLKTKYAGKNDAQMWATIKAGMLSNVPYAIFLALPFFALFTKLLYVRRGYYFGEHFVYALHIHAFTFFAMLLLILIPNSIASGVLITLASLYYFVGLHRFFGGRWWMNCLRYFVLAMLYPTFLCIVATVLLLVVFIG